MELGRASWKCSSQESLLDNKDNYFLVSQCGWDNGWAGQWLVQTYFEMVSLEARLRTGCKERVPEETHQEGAAQVQVRQEGSEKEV